MDTNHSLTASQWQSVLPYRDSGEGEHEFLEYLSTFHSGVNAPAAILVRWIIDDQPCHEWHHRWSELVKRAQAIEAAEVAAILTAVGWIVGWDIAAPTVVSDDWQVGELFSGLLSDLFGGSATIGDIPF